MTDREKAGLRGPVRTRVEETIYPGGKFLTTTEYSLDGRFLATRASNPDGSAWVTTQTYDADGRLVKTASGNSGERAAEILYTYDEGGRLKEIRDADGKGNRTSYRYDQQGHKTEIKGFAPEVIERNRGGITTESLWDAAQMGIGVPTGGSVTTLYNDRDLPIEEQILDSEGRVVSRFNRTYDANGRIMEENQIQENPALLMVERFSAEQRVQLDDKQLEAMNRAMKSMLSGRSGTGKSYTYDSQGRVTEVRDRNFAMDRVTTTSYNEHGDKSEERMTLAGNTVFPVGVEYSISEDGTLVPSKAASNAPSFPELPKLDIVEYHYEYDHYGNWTEQAVIHRSESNEYSTVRRRALTYY
jgi:YD repeat-containing protein